MTVIPGIGYDTAAVVVSELGADFSRFPTERRFAAYLDKGAEAFEKRLRERSLKTVKTLIKLHGINQLELQTAFAVN